ncbi:MAG: hypothetical protein ACE5FF_13355 [Saprospiraceae bacterium]
MAGLALIAILALSGAGIYLALKTLQNYKPGRRKIQKDLEQIKTRLHPLVKDLVPWNREEMEQLSLNQIHKSKKKGVVTTVQGVFTTIYHEPVIVYSYRKYVSPSENALIYARTSKHELIYRVKNDKVEVVINNHLVGIVNEKGVLTDNKGRNMLAQITRSGKELLLPVKIGNKEVGNVVNPKYAKKVNPRAFEFVGPMQEEEEALFLSLSVLELIRQNR